MTIETRFGGFFVVCSFDVHLRARTFSNHRVHAVHPKVARHSRFVMLVGLGYFEVEIIYVSQKRKHRF